ncbi:MerR family transcriptional regulator [Enemella dayhoffiae]|uniref:MerR family transcriptional regulator n=1 Tax=Enemella dayhoffiae TaxID=2016507 RepID=A0A255H9J7_9ACTN|nr:MerR family transcriptional regulator [Enemella dayhoffiae]OYO23916.1 MerR family transcriptional regulator [Enemella dayhoffiae]
MLDTSDLMSIGEFSALTRISIRMVRHHESHGVLVPAAVDELTGHRRYAMSQLPRALAIRRLRDCGFGVSSMGPLLAARGSDAYAEALRMQRQTLTQEYAAARQRLDNLSQLITEDQGLAMNDISIERRTDPAQTFITLRGVVANYAAEGELWQRFMPLLGQQGISPIGPGGCIEHDEEYKEADVDESVFVPVAAGVTAQAPLEVFDLPAQEVVVGTLRGAYHRLGDVHARIAEHLQQNGLRPAARTAEGVVGKHYNVYLNAPPQVAEEDRLTELHLPIR